MYILATLVLLIVLAKYIIPMIARKIAIRIMAKRTKEEEVADACKLFSLLKFYVCGICVIEIIYIIPLCFILAEIYSAFGFSEFIPDWVPIVLLIAFVVLQTIFSLYNCFIKTQKYNLKLLKKTFNRYLSWLLFSAVISLVVIVFPMFNLVLPVAGNRILNMLIWLTLLYMIMIAVCIWGIKTGKKLITVFYGAEAFSKNDKAVEVLSFTRLIEMRNEQKVKTEKVALSIYVRNKCGSAMAGIKANKTKLLKIGCVAIAYIVLLIVSLVMFARSSDIFRLPVLKSAGLSKSGMITFLGEPMKKTEDEKNGYFVYEYYSGEYGETVKKIEALTKAAENVNSFDKLFELMEEQARLEEKLENLDYKYIRAVGTPDGVSVYFDTNAGEDRTEKKWREGNEGKIELGYAVHTVSTLGYSGKDIMTVDCENISRRNNDNICVMIYYNDGSYASYKLDNYKFSDLHEGENKLTWADSWGSYTVTVNVTY